MAMEFIQRIVIDGPAEDVKRLEAGLVRIEERTHRRKRWTERVPFSFAAAYKLLKVRRVPPEDPHELGEFRRRATDALGVRHRLESSVARAFESRECAASATP